MAKSLTVEQVAEHATEQDCWIIVHGKVYDVTKFLNEHPGGKKVLLKAAGTDATKQFDQFHNQQVLGQWGPQLEVGILGTAETEERMQSLLGTGQNDTFGDMVPFGDPMWYQDWYSPYYNDSHRRLRAAVRAFVDKEITPFCYEWDEAKKIPAELFVKCANLGILSAVVGSPLPVEYMEGLPPVAGVKAEEFDPFHELIVTDELARCGAGGVLWGLTGGLGIGLPPIIKFGTPFLKKKVVADCLSGRKTICLAITEPYAGSDVANIRCEAKEEGDFYVVNGEKKWITNGVFADYFTVAVRTGGAGTEGVSLLLIERTFKGVSTRQMNCSGVWSSGTAYITFEDVRVPKANLIGKKNHGFKHIMFNFNHERIGIAIQATRFARVCLEESLVYGHKRKTFGQKLVDHPVIRNKLAHMARQVEATYTWIESLTYQAKMMPLELQPLRLGGPIALLKAQATQTFEYCAREAAQIFGGLAYTRGGQGEKVERLYREVRAYAIPGGSEEIMLDLGVRQALRVGTVMGSKL